VLGALRDALRCIVSAAATPRIPQSVQEQLRLLANRLLLVIDRDDGRS
jgi:hypothetical protein